MELQKANRSCRIWYLGDPSVTIDALQTLRGCIKTHMQIHLPLVDLK